MLAGVTDHLAMKAGMIDHQPSPTCMISHTGMSTAFALEYVGNCALLPTKSTLGNKALKVYFTRFTDESYITLCKACVFINFKSSFLDAGLRVKYNDQLNITKYLSKSVDTGQY